MAVRKFSLERDVKRAVKEILKARGACWFMPVAGEFSRSGISDFIAVIRGRAIAIETKFGRNKPTPLQLRFGEEWQKAGGYFFVVNETNLKEFEQELDRLLSV